MPRARPIEGGGTAVPAPQSYAPVPLQPSEPVAGWYRDPGGAHQYRFWNGSAWTPGVANGPYVGHDFSAPPPTPWSAAQEPDTRAGLPPVAAAYAFGGIVAAIALSFLGALIATLVLPHSRFLILVLSQTGLWTGLVGAAAIVSRKFGTGNIWRDFGVRFRGMDVGWGLLVSFIARFAGFILLIPLVMIDRRLIGSDVAPLRGARHDSSVLIAVVLMVVIGAPFIEELFFRGLLLRSLMPVAGTAGAIVIQGLVFGALHMRPSYGLGNVSIFVVIAAMGVIQGVVAERFRRLGPGIVAHGFFNLFALLLALALHTLR
ncbi:MAG: protease family protein [Actinomycetota bacterium]|nr:protease family protein [Actinomycetota bacterium]